MDPYFTLADRPARDPSQHYPIHTTTYILTVLLVRARPSERYQNTESHYYYYYY